MDHDRRSNGQVALGSAVLQDPRACCQGLRTGQDRLQWPAGQGGAGGPRGDLLQIRNEGGEFQVEVLLLSEVRGPAAVAQTLYRETEASREVRLKLAEERKAMAQFEVIHAGRPSKRDRRLIHRFRGD